MDRSATLDVIASWPVQDRVEFLFDLWDQIVDAGWKPTVTPELQSELDRRLAAHEADPSRAMTWEQVVAHVRRPRA